MYLNRLKSAIIYFAQALSIDKINQPFDDDAFICWHDIKLLNTFLFFFRMSKYKLTYVFCSDISMEFVIVYVERK